MLKTVRYINVLFFNVCNFKSCYRQISLKKILFFFPTWGFNYQILQLDQKLISLMLPKAEMEELGYGFVHLKLFTDPNC